MTAARADDFKSLELIQAGGGARQQGVTELYRAYASRFARFFARNRVPVDHVEDLVQEVFVSIVRSCADFRGDCDVSIWMWSIARNTMLSYFRKESRHRMDDGVEVDELSEDHGRTSSAPGESLEDCVRGGFERFFGVEEERARALMLAALEGWSTAELAEYLGRSLGATREYISQCRKRLQPYIRHCLDYLAT